jgi:hypothetical protein
VQDLKPTERLAHVANLHRRHSIPSDISGG